MIINRETYSLLDWLGDLGGLFDALFLIFSLIVAPVASFSMRATLLSKFFRFKPLEEKIKRSESQSDAAKHFFNLFNDHSSSSSKASKLEVMKEILTEFSVRQRIEKLSFYSTNLLCNRDYKKRLFKSHNKMNKELDLQKFIHR